MIGHEVVQVDFLEVQCWAKCIWRREQTLGWVVKHEGAREYMDIAYIAGISECDEEVITLGMGYNKDKRVQVYYMT